MEGNNNRVRVSVKEFQSRFSTKNECYNFLTIDVKAYCPPRDCVTAWHLRDMAMGTKGFVKQTEIRHLTVPFYHEILNVETILAWARANFPLVVEQFFPSQEKELLKMPRQVSCSFHNLSKF